MEKKFQKDLTAIRTLLRPRDEEYNISSLEDVLNLCHSVYGTVANRNPIIRSVAGAAAATDVDDIPVPADRIWYVIAAQTSHDDSGVAHNQAIQIRFGGLVVGLVQDADPNGVIDNVPLAMPRPVYLPPGANLRGHVRGIGAGDMVTLVLLYLDLELGEYTEGA